MTVVSGKTKEIVTEIYISTDLITVDENTIGIFALDSHTVGLSNNPPKSWQDLRLWDSKAKIVKEEEEITVILPPEIVQFYRPRKIELASSLEKDSILLVIT